MTELKWRAALLAAPRPKAANNERLGRRIFARFPEREDIEFLLSKARLRPCSAKCQHRRIDGFVCQLESAEVHREAAAWP